MGHLLKVLTHLSLKHSFYGTSAYSVGPDQTPQNVVSEGSTLFSYKMYFYNFLFDSLRPTNNLSVK